MDIKEKNLEFFIKFDYKFSKIYNQIKDFLEENLSYYKSGYQFTEAFLNGKWDGKVRLYKEHKDKFIVEIGFLKDILKFFSENGIRYKVLDDTLRKGEDIEKNLFWQGKELRWYQKEAVEKLLENRIGIISLPTGSGKMLVACYLIYKLKRKCIFVVRNLESVSQTYNELVDSVGNLKVGTWLSFQKNIKNADVVLTTFNSLGKSLKDKNELYFFADRCDAIIVDEAHHISDNIYKKIIKAFDFYYVYGMTGTAFRNDKSDLEIKGLFGDVAYKIKVKDLQEGNILAKSKIYFLKVSNFVLDKDEFLKDFPEFSSLAFRNINYVDTQNVYKLGIVYNKIRTQIIKNLINRFKDKKTLILVKYIYHGEYLSRMLKIPFVSGQSSKKMRTESLERFRNDDSFNVMIASTIYDESINIPELEVLINATGHSSSVSQIQRHGRIIRKHNENKEAIFIDFFDEFDSRMKSHSLKRIKSFKKENLEPIITSSKDFIFDLTGNLE
jgi:superfamily II DNA or RNA helicase